MYGKNAFRTLDDVIGYPPTDNSYVGPTTSGSGPNRRYQTTTDDQTTVIQMSKDEKSRQPEPWNWWLTVWSVISLLLCPAFIYCTFGALICNIMAYVDYKAGDHERKRLKLLCAVGWSLASFIAGCVTLLIVLIVLFTAYGAQNWNVLPPVPGPD